jgi:hypothetical protein
LQGRRAGTGFADDERLALDNLLARDADMQRRSGSIVFLKGAAHAPGFPRLLIGYRMLICVPQNDDFGAVEDKRDAALLNQGHEFGCGAKP